MVILTYPGGQEVRINANSIISYRNKSIEVRLEHQGTPAIIQGTELSLSGTESSFVVTQSPEEIDAILRTNLITVYEYKK